MDQKNKKYHKVIVMTEEDCGRDDEMMHKKREKRKEQNVTFMDWIKDYLKGEKSYYGGNDDNHDG